MGSIAPDYDVAIVGAGVVGLACAALLSRQARVLVLEREGRCGTVTSSRNSGVIHAGLYYPQGSLKARLCVRGRELLYERCNREGIGHRKLGKLVVAESVDDLDALAVLHSRALDNGAGSVKLIGARALQQLEPNVTGLAALLSPETGIVDAQGLMESYRRQAQEGGADLALHHRLIAVETADQMATLVVQGSGGRERVRVRVLVNAAGLDADEVAALCGLDVDALGYRQQACKGDYFALAPRLRGLVSRLIYPMPGQAGLGVHVTSDLAGQLLAGPDAAYVSTRTDYTVDARKASVFAAALRRYLPQVRDEDLSPALSGIRPKLQGPGEAFRDFVVTREEAVGLPFLVNLIGIESPGLTASEAIAEEVVALISTAF